MASNPYYGQDIAGSISALGKLFEPVSGTNAYGYTKAASERANMERIAELYNMSKSGNLTPEQMTQMDRSSVIAGLYSPNQSYYSVDQSNATSRANNAADNATLVATNRADNAQKMAQARYGAISEGAVLPAMPQSVAEMYGLPADAGSSGNVKVGTGDTVFTPFGGVMRGQVTAKPGEVIMPPTQGVPQAPAPAQPQASTTSQDVAPPAPQSVSIPLRTGNPFLDALMGATGVPPVAGAKILPPEAAQPGPQPAGSPAAAGAPAPYDVNSVVTGGPAVSKAGQTEFDKYKDRKMATLDESIFENARKSLDIKGSLDRMKAALASPNMDTGKLATLRLEARKTLAAFGVDTGNVSEEEMFRALVGKMALSLRNPATGEGMPGAMSDQDRAYLQSLAPSLENTPEGNAKLVDYYGRIAQRNLEFEQLRQRYTQQHGRIDDGFRAEMVDFANKNPLFPEANAVTATPAPTPTSNVPGLQGIPLEAIEILKKNPKTAAAFDKQFGRPGAAQMVLGGAQ